MVLATPELIYPKNYVKKRFPSFLLQLFVPLRDYIQVPRYRIIRDFFSGLQMPVHPATAAGPDHSKSLEKSELYPSLYQGPDQTKVLPSTPAPQAQIYSTVNNFPANRSNDVYRYDV